MPVAATDLKLYLSGGASNAVVNASLGGAISSTEISSTPLNNLFDNVDDTEANNGDIEYRCFYVKNTHATDSLTLAAVYIASNSPSADTVIAIGLDPAGLSGTATTIANEGATPSGVTFSAAASAGAALSIGTLAAGAYQAIWVRRTVDEDADASASDPFTLRFTGTP